MRSVSGSVLGGGGTEEARPVNGYHPQRTGTQPQTGEYRSHMNTPILSPTLGTALKTPILAHKDTHRQITHTHTHHDQGNGRVCTSSVHKPNSDGDYLTLHTYLSYILILCVCVC